MIKKWLEDLKRIDIIDSMSINRGKVYYLKSPFIIRVKKDVLKKIKKEYDIKVEKGGILLGKPLKEKKVKIVEICDVIFVKNISKTPWRSYRHNPSEFKNAITYCFRKEKKESIYYPLYFHTHPTYSKENLYSLLEYFNQLGTSEADQSLSKEDIKINSFSLIIPNALIVGTEELGGRLFIGFYGGNIAPPDFRRYMGKLTGETFGEIFDMMKKRLDRPWKWILLISVCFIFIRYPKILIPLLLIILLSMKIIPLAVSSAEEITNYFTEVDNKDVLIRIPEYNELNYY